MEQSVQLENLKDIRDLAQIDDYSLIFFILIIIFFSLLFVFLIFIIKKYFFTKKQENKKEISLKYLQTLDYKDSKSQSYKITKCVYILLQDYGSEKNSHKNNNDKNSSNKFNINSSKDSKNDVNDDDNTNNVIFIGQNLIKTLQKYKYIKNAPPFLEEDKKEIQMFLQVIQNG